MTNTQIKANSIPAGGPLVAGPRISMFDKKGQANLARINRGPNIQVNQNKVNVPQFRINQHKGA